MQNWWNDYIGIPYVEKGRDKTGLDCWGLVRLIYQEQFDIELPSFVQDYAGGDNDRAAELIAIGKEGWNETKEPVIGDVVLIRLNGLFSHVGVVISPNQFLHVREGYDSVVERFDTGVWKHRTVGFFKYAEKAAHGNSDISFCPHPLKTERIDGKIPANSTVKDVVDFIKIQYPVAAEYNVNPMVMVNGAPVLESDWQLVIKEGDRIEYRAVATGGKIGRLILTIAVVVAAAYFAPVIAGQFGITSALGISAVQAGLSIVGNLLINAIFPIRPPKVNLPKDPGSAKAQALLQGGSNQANQYGAIPVVLGKSRYTAALGATIYAESSTDKSYLRMILVWGYGPLQISDMRIGDTPIDTLEEVIYETLNGFDDTPEDKARFNSIYGRDVEQLSINQKLLGAWQVDTASIVYPYIERVLNEEVDNISVTLYFPQGLRTLILDGSKAGEIEAYAFRGVVQARQLDSDTLVPITSFTNVESYCAGAVINLSPAWFNVDSDAELEPVYQWTRITVDERSKVKTYKGAFSLSSGSNPTGNLLLRQQQANFGFNSTYNLIPDIPDGEELIWDVIVYGNSVFSTTDRRASAGAVFTGCGITITGLQAAIGTGTIARSFSELVRIGALNERFYKRKDAFSLNVNFAVARGKYEVRVRRASPDGGDELRPGEGLKRSRQDDAYLTSITGSRAARPINPPKPLAMTAIRVKATDQFNGNLDGISATVQTICKDWDVTTSTWIVRPTRNPASLFRHVLQHPANAKAVADAAIDLDTLITWHTYCRTKQFMFDRVISQTESLYDVLKDICAAGRSSPTLKDGKWTVITDTTKSVVSQFFTPHNSWGFESVKTIPNIPHAFRVQFQNSEKGFQADEMIVYNDGYSSANATLFETLELTGVTTKTAIFKHARFHFAQLKLRPETYTLNADIEHLICTRGDLVRVSHDVPLWGLGSGRIVSRVTATQLELDESMPMDAGVQYTIRIRLEDGTSVTRTVVAKVTDGLYNVIDLTASITAIQAATGNLFMFGALSEETVELIVQSIEPSENMSAQLTLVDYAPAIQNSDTEDIPPFDSQITLPPVLLQNKITQVPTIFDVVSDETVMLIANAGTYQIRIKASYTNPATLPSTVTFVEGQLEYLGDATEDWQFTQSVPVKTGSIYFSDVQELEEYKLRLRYVTNDGRFGAWSSVITHTVVGKTNPPSEVTGLTASIDDIHVKLDWANNPEVDVVAYEVRSTDSGWGDGSFIFNGLASTCSVNAPIAGSSQTWYVRAVDANGLYSETSTSVTFTTTAIPIPATLTHVFADTSLTNATITLDWADVSPQFGIDFYRITYGAIVKQVKASTITLPADWIGARSFTLNVVDRLGNVSGDRTISVTKLAPNPVTGLRAQVIDNNVQLFWNNPAKTTLPIQDAIVKKGATYAGATIIGTKSGAFTTVQETRAGTYTYWVAVRDTDNNESTPVGVTAKVSEPPDFVFNAEYISTFGATKSSAINEQGGVLIPVKTTETWTQHYVNNSWTTPAQQIAAGYPIFIQPSAASGYYEETFDYGTVLGSSQITIDYQGTTLDDVVTLRTDIAVSDDNVTFSNSENVSSIFATNFRYVKVRFTVTSDTVGLYLLNNLSTVLDAKLINDAGTMSAVSTDANGTIVNFNKEFIDIQSINVSPSGTTLLSPVYNFQDAVLTGTYSVTSNVATVNVTGHDLVAGQKVRLNFTSGTAPNGVYTVATTPTANQFTVSVTTANTSGNISIYPEGFRVYLFNSAGTRVSGTVSWQVRGY